jgi:hypothetical protein
MQFDEEAGMNPAAAAQYRAQPVIANPNFSSKYDANTKSIGLLSQCIRKVGQTVLFVDVAAGQFNFACNIAHGILRVGLHFRYRYQNLSEIGSLGTGPRIQLTEGTKGNASR